jgi:hypothetical protein
MDLGSSLQLWQHKSTLPDFDSCDSCHMTVMEDGSAAMIDIWARFYATPSASATSARWT